WRRCVTCGGANNANVIGIAISTIAVGIFDPGKRVPPRRSRHDNAKYCATKRRTHHPEAHGITIATGCVHHLLSVQ
ncbi:hypothetical protein HPP92_006520, partial [Vanilla planifolia]